MLFGAAETVCAEYNNTLKPGPPHQLRLAQNHPQALGLRCLILFENPGALAASSGSGDRDYANPSQSFFNQGSAKVITTCPFGGVAYATDSAATSLLQLNFPLPSTNVWTLSTLIQY